MTLRQTILFFAKGDTVNLIKIEIYTSDLVSDGFWNIDNNKVVLTDLLYSHFRDCKTQLLQKKFFDKLRKVSTQLIG